MRLEQRCTGMPELLPSLREWSENSLNRCTPEDITQYWKEYDVLTFLVDFGVCNSSYLSILDAGEKAQEKTYKSDYFRKRFAVSRSTIKQILQPIMRAKKASDIHLGKEKKGRVTILGRPDIFISLSYSGTYIALTIGKQKIGSDIEMVHSLKIRKIQSWAFFYNAEGSNENDHIRTFLHQWTVVESFVKLRDMALYPLLKERFFLTDAHFTSYLIDQRFILSLASDSPHLEDVLLRINPENWHHASTDEDLHSVHEEKPMATDQRETVYS
jgi:4'-phosphopantetheinyl transferase